MAGKCVALGNPGTQTRSHLPSMAPFGNWMYLPSPELYRSGRSSQGEPVRYFQRVVSVHPPTLTALASPLHHLGR